MSSSKRARSKRGASAIIVALVLSALINIVVFGWNQMNRFQGRGIAHRIAYKGGTDQNHFAVELLKQLMDSQVIISYLAPLKASTFAVAVPNVGWNWAFTDGFPQSAAAVPVAQMTVNVCDARQIPSNVLVANAYRPTPVFPPCPATATTPVGVTIPDIQSNKYIEIYSSVTVPQ